MSCHVLYCLLSLALSEPQLRKQTFTDNVVVTDHNSSSVHSLKVL